MLWPPLPLDSWQDTRDTLHMWTQITGKICLALAPPVNHYWGVTLHVTPRGLMTPALPDGDRTFTMTFDLVDHALVIDASDKARQAIPLRPQTVADFYRALMDALHGMGIDVRIWTMPVEVPAPIRFTEDVTHRAYDAAAAHTFLEVLLAISPTLEEFRAGFVGKCSPVHFFWGSFDLAVTRFSGRPAEPPRQDPEIWTREAYSHEVISHGWWPGGGPVNEPAFYAYAAPEPDGFKTAAVAPAAAFYSKEFKEFILPYAAVRTGGSPEADLRSFLRTTYDAAATLAGWDRHALERTPLAKAVASAAREIS
jgi:hypothetical protein